MMRLESTVSNESPWESLVISCGSGRGLAQEIWIEVTAFEV